LEASEEDPVLLETLLKLKEQEVSALAVPPEQRLS